VAGRKIAETSNINCHNQAVSELFVDVTIKSAKLQKEKQIHEMNQY
jgi:hypothetical protein